MLNLTFGVPSSSPESCFRLFEVEKSMINSIEFFKTKSGKKFHINIKCSYLKGKHILKVFGIKKLEVSFFCKRCLLNTTDEFFSRNIKSSQIEKLDLKDHKNEKDVKYIEKKIYTQGKQTTISSFQNKDGTYPLTKRKTI